MSQLGAKQEVTEAATRDSALEAIESHSIDVIPEDERTGRIRGQFWLWFASNANVFNVVLGGFAVLLGLNVLWAVLAVIAGTLLGMVFTSLHAVQGPRLGVPQMIQSRGQFGFYGALIIFVASVVLDVGYLAGGQVVGAQSMNSLVPAIAVPWWVILFTIPAALLAIFGYRLIHFVQPYLTVLFSLVLAAVVVLILTSHDHLAKGMSGAHLASFPVFIAAAGLFFMNMLSWAVYTSDYSRYLPRDVSAPRVFWAVFTGAGLSTCLYCGLGVWITAISPAASTVSALAVTAGRWILPLMALSLITGAGMNAYTGMLSIESARSTWQRVTASRLARIAGIMFIFVVATILAVSGYRTFLTDFTNFLDVLLFLFVPWSVINLIDFYLIRREQYDVQSFFTPSGSYGGWRWVAIIPYLIGLAAQVPFIDQTLYTGPMVKVLGGADISWIVGFVVAGAGYLIACRLASPHTPAAPGQAGLPLAADPR
jgi:nucleobase:cation symporter-1, NCS1 family